MENLEGYILREIGAISRCIQTINDCRFREYGLQKGQFIFLTRICENQGLSQIDLTNIAKVDKTTTAKAIQKLSEEGFIYKKRDPADNRVWRLYPTPKALDLYALIIAEENKNIGICCRGFNEEDREAAYRTVRKMRENIETEWKLIKNY